MDVSSLYTNIPHSDDKQSVLYYLQNNPDSYTRPEQPTPDVLVELIDINTVFLLKNWHENNNIALAWLI